MITRNLRNISAMVLQSFSVSNGVMTIKGVDGKIWYLSRLFSKFPSARSEVFTATATAEGISFGTGTTPATDLDANLEATITSGITVTLAEKIQGVDPPLNPYVLYRFSISNNGSSALSISEVGYKQTVKVASTPGRDDSADVVALLDRTVLDDPLIIQGGDVGILEYKLVTHTAPDEQIGGVDIVSFTYGTDAQIEALIDAAGEGTIDLQEDAHWRVGDARKIHINAFTADGYTHAAQDIDIVISSFSDYNGCGCLFQFDFLECLATACRMNSTDTTVGGYGATNMKTITLPALVQALPTWLQDRLATFDVIATKGDGSTETETVSGNKLALRSTMEAFGSKQNAKAEEGSFVDLYKVSSYRIKKQGWSGSAGYWWERSPYSGTYFCYVNTSGTATSNGASNAFGVAPFGCIKPST